MSSLLLVITGASRGLGQAIATAFCKHEPLTTQLSSMRALLVARSRQGLVQTKEAMQNAAESHPFTLDVSTHSMDLSNLDTLDDNIDKLLQEAGSFSFDRIILISNAGSLGHLGKLEGLTSLQDLRRDLDFNVTSPLWLSVRFARKLSSKCSNMTMVNISSKCAIEAFPTMGVYCTGKAARDMFHQVWAKENVGENVKLLNYAPGALETDMTASLRLADGLDEGLQSFFRNSHESGELILPEHTAQRMVKLVWDNEFESGAHIDYWDLADGE